MEKAVITTIEEEFVKSSEGAKKAWAARRKGKRAKIHKEKLEEKKWPVKEVDARR